jgi:hypothetical protein
MMGPGSALPGMLKDKVFEKTGIARSINRDCRLAPSLLLS